MADTTSFRVIVSGRPNYSEPSRVRMVDVPNEELSNDVHSLLETIFKYGQNDFQPKNCNSVSVGDMVILNDSIWACCNWGWSEIPILK